MKFLSIAIILFLSENLVQADVSHLSLRNEINNNQYLPPLPTKATLNNNESASDNVNLPNETPKEISNSNSGSLSNTAEHKQQRQQHQQQRFHTIESIQPSIAIASFSIQSDTPAQGVSNAPLNPSPTYNYNRPAAGLQAIQQIQSQSVLQQNAYLPPTPIQQIATASVDSIDETIQEPQTILSAPEPSAVRYQQEDYSAPDTTSAHHLQKTTTISAATGILPAPVTEIVSEAEPISESSRQTQGFSHQQLSQQQVNSYRYQSPEQVVQPIQYSAPRPIVQQTVTALAPAISSIPLNAPVSYSVREPVTYSAPASAPYSIAALPITYSTPTLQTHSQLPPSTLSYSSAASARQPLHYTLQTPLTYSAPVPLPVTYSSKSTSLPSILQQTTYSAQVPVIRKTLAPPVFQQSFETPQTLAGNYDYSTPNGQYALSATPHQVITYSQPAQQLYTPTILSTGSSSSLSSLSRASIQEVGTQYASNGGYIY